ncbi:MULTISPECIES: 5-oxoprolinase subunit PxpA [unclassified Microbacterium]|uniref:5-oxoprolinase subunit PxpA n=1 Tax=unclassified Microbacterium TaxID=2609290 RepID=UPI001E5C4AB7|nr:MULTISPECIES: 5-oxoprolinase subunit PxpA [unclassified Microbacterium]
MHPVTAASVDLNADLGETVDGAPTADDEAMFAVISSANIATGGHAGDASSMRLAVERAARYGVAVGAHPSYPDRGGFGRAAMDLAPAELTVVVSGQLAALRAAGADIRYVKPHGALYHAVGMDADLARALVRAVVDLSDALGRAVPVLALGAAAAEASAAAGLPFVREAFLDRGYTPGGELVPRGMTGALLHDPSVVAERAVRLARDGVVEAIDGTLVVADAASLCLHGDTPEAVAMARAVRAALDVAGVEVRAPW